MPYTEGDEVFLYPHKVLLRARIGEMEPDGSYNARIYDLQAVVAPPDAIASSVDDRPDSIAALMARVEALEMTRVQSNVEWRMAVDSNEPEALRKRLEEVMADKHSLWAELCDQGQRLVRLENDLRDGAGKQSYHALRVERDNLDNELFTVKAKITVLQDDLLELMANGVRLIAERDALKAKNAKLEAVLSAAGDYIVKNNMETYLVLARAVRALDA